MSRITTPLVALALCLTLICLTLPRARASAHDAPRKKEARQGESCATCPAGSPGKRADRMSNLATAGRRAQQMPFAPVQRSFFDGARINMVGTADGSLVFAVTDLKLVSGLMPLAFARVYSSDRTEDRGLGAGWSFAYDDRIRMTGDGAVLSTAAGGDIAFRREGEGGRFVLNTPEPGLHQSFEEAADGTLTESAAGMTRTYQRVGGEYRLARVADQNGNAVSISFDRRGNISRVDGVGGQSLTLNWSAGKSSGKSAGKRPQLISVTDNVGRRTSYEVRGGTLSTFVDQAGSRWTYDYAGGRLTGASDPVGRVVLRARYDSEGRAVEAGDAVGSHRFEYGEGRTIVTDPMGAKTTFTHNALGAVASVTDDEGVMAAVEYDESNQPVRVSDSAGNQQTFASEAAGKGAAAAAAGGGATAYTFDARGNVLTARSGNPATSYRAVRNGRGQPVSLRAESGRELSFEYDTAGNETVFNHSDFGRFETSYDGAGRKTSERVPSGRSLGYRYDAHGQVARVTDNSARSLTIQRDASGMVVRSVDDTGREVRVTRDAAGRPTRLEFREGKSRQFAYDARGALTYYRDAQGRQYGMTYDRVGRLQKVDKSDGVTLRYRYGRDGRVASVSREVRGSAPGFVKTGFKMSPPAARDYEEGEGCMFVDDGYGTVYDTCDPSLYLIDPATLVQSWYEQEYARGFIPFHQPEQTPFECLRAKYAICSALHESCMADVEMINTLALIACLALTAWRVALCLGAIGIAYSRGVRKCFFAWEACRLEAEYECSSVG